VASDQPTPEEIALTACYGICPPMASLHERWPHLVSAAGRQHLRIAAAAVRLSRMNPGHADLVILKEDAIRQNRDAVKRAAIQAAEAEAALAASILAEIKL
jgi:hypothetical protein